MVKETSVKNLFAGTQSFNTYFLSGHCQNTASNCDRESTGGLGSSRFGNNLFTLLLAWTLEKAGEDITLWQLALFFTFLWMSHVHYLTESQFLYFISLFYPSEKHKTLITFTIKGTKDRLPEDVPLWYTEYLELKPWEK